MAILRLIRFPNLIIVVLTQYLLQYCVLIPTLEKAKLSPILDHFHFGLLVLSTLMIAAGGYIINDIVDYKIDLINKPDRVIINKNISIKPARILYHSNNLIGLLISLYLAYHVDNIALISLYIVAVFLMYLYSISLKSKALLGNIVVGLFCAFVAGIVLFAERAAYADFTTNLGSYQNELTLLFGGYMLFAFLTTMFREIVKDIEDVKGDTAQDCQTLPIVSSIGFAKKVAAFFGVLVLAFTSYIGQLVYPHLNTIHLIYILIGIIFPTIASLYLLGKAQSTAEFHRISRLAKYLMLSGILFLMLVIL